MDDDNDQSAGFWTDALSNPWISGAYALGNGLLAGMTPGTARLSQGLNTGLELGLGAEKRDYERRQKQRLSESLGALADTKIPVTSTKIGMDPEKTTFSLPNSLPVNGRLDASLSPLAPPKPLPTYKATEDKPIFTPTERAYLKAVPTAQAAKIMGSAIFKEPQKPTAVRPGGALVDANGNVVYQAPAAADKDVWQSYATDLGDKIETGVYNKATGQRRISSITPKGAAPIAPERIADMEARRDIQREGLDLRRQTSEELANLRREALQDRQAARDNQAAMLSQTERDRAMKPEDIRMAEAAITKSALARSVDKMPPRAQQAALKKIAADYGFEIEGEPKLTRGGYLFGNDALVGDFSLRPKPLTTRTEKSRGGAGAGSGRSNDDPLGIRGSRPTVGGEY